MFRPLLILFLAVFLAACSADSHAPEMMTPLELVVEANDFSFSPVVIEVGAGQPVRLTLNNQGLLEHDWSVERIAVTDVREHSAQSAGHGDHMHSMAAEPDLHVAAMPGESGVVTFTVTEPGSYKVICTVAGHEEAGMVATLVVSGP